VLQYLKVSKSKCCLQKAQHHVGIIRLSFRMFNNFSHIARYLVLVCVYMCKCMYVTCVCVCVCVREREREKKKVYCGIFAQTKIYGVRKQRLLAIGSEIFVSK
jgi:hypothetical protein